MPDRKPHLEAADEVAPGNASDTRECGPPVRRANQEAIAQAIDVNSPPARNLRIAVLISGAGSNLQNLIDRIASRRLRRIEIGVVISSRSNVRGVERAQAARLPVEIIRVKDHADAASFSCAVTDALERHHIDLAVMAGWLCHWQMPPHWLGRTINLHPSLLPDYGGKGFYGRRVHEAVLAAGETRSGATIHWVDNEYDHGEILLQGHCRVQPDDTPEALAQRVGLLEFRLLPAAIEMIRDQWRHEGKLK